MTGPDFFDTSNFHDMVWTEEGGKVPENVANACLLTWFCSDDFTFDVHPNTSGYALVTDALEEALTWQGEALRRPWDARPSSSP